MSGIPLSERIDNKDEQILFLLLAGMPKYWFCHSYLESLTQQKNSLEDAVIIADAQRLNCLYG
jgi:hypothetical protein